MGALTVATSQVRAQHRDRVQGRTLHRPARLLGRAGGREGERGGGLRVRVREEPAGMASVPVMRSCRLRMPGASWPTYNRRGCSRRRILLSRRSDAELASVNFAAFDAAAERARVGWLERPVVRRRHDRSMGLMPDERPGTALDLSCPRAGLGLCTQVLGARRASSFCPGGRVHWLSLGVHCTACHTLGKPVLQYPELTPVELPKVVTDPARARIVTDGWRAVRAVGS